MHIIYNICLYIYIWLIYLMLIIYISTYIHKMWTFCQIKHGWLAGVGEEIWAGGQGCNCNPTLTIDFTKKLYLSIGVVSGG